MTALAAGLEVLDRAWADDGQALVAAKCAGLLRGYAARWADAPYRIVATESVLASPLYNPATERQSRTFTLAGKLDVRVIDAAGRRGIFDHKTTSQDIADLNAPYWQQLAVEGQVSHYFLLEWLNQNDVDFGVWDVVRKPQISPKALSKAEVAAVLEFGRYFDFALVDEELEQFREGGRETVGMYGARLAHDCVFGRPLHYFQRREVVRLYSEMLMYTSELWGHGQDILASRKTGRHPRNSGGCFAYNTPCNFLGVCSGHDTIDSERWTEKAYVHNELPVLGDGRGTEVLTNSRIRCWQTCRQKHYFQYELGVERVDAEEKEALFFGTVFHEALEQFFVTLQREQEAAPVHG